MQRIKMHLNEHWAHIMRHRHLRSRNSHTAWQRTIEEDHSVMHLQDAVVPACSCSTPTLQRKLPCTRNLPLFFVLFVRVCVCWHARTTPRV
jgi:hypothetical protein